MQIWKLKRGIEKLRGKEVHVLEVLQAFEWTLKIEEKMRRKNLRRMTRKSMQRTMMMLMVPLN